MSGREKNDFGVAKKAVVLLKDLWCGEITKHVKKNRSAYQKSAIIKSLKILDEKSNIVLGVHGKNIF